MQLYVAPAFSMVPARALALCPALNAESAANLLHFVMASIQPPSQSLPPGQPTIQLPISSVLRTFYLQLGHWAVNATASAVFTLSVEL